MESTIKKDAFFGISKEELFFKLNNNLVREVDEKIYFKSDADGQFDYMLYLTLLSRTTLTGHYYVTIPILAKSMGFKPRTGTGNINDKIKKSLDRLKNEYRLIELSYDGKEIFGEVIELRNSNGFFKMKMIDLTKILCDEMFKMDKDDYTCKYNDKAKAIYVYSYLLSMMGDHETTECTVKWHGCFPSLDKICEDCNVSKNYLMKLLAYFEYDGLIYTTNIGQITDSNGLISNSCNYYTDNIIYLQSSYIYSKAYYDNNNLKYLKYTSQVNKLLLEIMELLNKSYNNLKDKELICFKEHFVLMFNNILNESEKFFVDISKSKFDDYIKNKKYINSKFNVIDCKIPLLFIADNEMASIPLLNHFKNKIKALMYLYEVL